MLDLVFEAPSSERLDGPAAKVNLFWDPPKVFDKSFGFLWPVAFRAKTMVRVMSPY